VIGSDFGISGDGPGNQIDRRIEMLSLPGENAQQMKRIGMIGRFSQDLAIGGFRLGELTGLMQADGAGEGIIPSFIWRIIRGMGVNRRAGR